jgi:hypothetical protein
VGKASIRGCDFRVIRFMALVAENRHSTVHRFEQAQRFCATPRLSDFAFYAFAYAKSYCPATSASKCSTDELHWSSAQPRPTPRFYIRTAASRPRKGGHGGPRPPLLERNSARQRFQRRECPSPHPRGKASAPAHHGVRQNAHFIDRMSL